MNIKQALDEGHNENPAHVFAMAVAGRIERLGVKQVMAEGFGIALKIAKATECHVEVEDGGGYGFANDTFYFWSKSLGDKRPKF